MSYFTAVKFKDELWVPYGIKQIDGKPRVSSTDYLFDIAEWVVPWHEKWTKNGYNWALSNVEESLWAVWWDYVFPTVAMQMEVVSSSANDSSAGTWARTVIVTYLTNTFVEKSETITLNGTTPVATVGTDIYRVNRFRVATTGTGLQNAWDIDIRHISDTPIYSRIWTWINRALSCIYTVPKDKCLFIFNILFSAWANVAGRPVRFITKATYDDVNEAIVPFFVPYTNIIITDWTCDVPIEAPTKFCAWVDLKQNAVSPDWASYWAITVRWRLEDA
jgi:hypothetical protein